jgi:hypothetical protein
MLARSFGLDQLGFDAGKRTLNAVTEFATKFHIAAGMTPDLLRRAKDETTGIEGWEQQDGQPSPNAVRMEAFQLRHSYSRTYS